MKANAQDIKKLREITGAGFADCKNALEEAKGDLKKAEGLLKEKGIAKAAKKGDRATGSGLVDTYVHLNGRIGVALALLCETDFVARTDEFKNLAHEVSMQIAAMDPKDEKELLAQDYIRDGSKTIDGLVKEAIAKLGENIQVGEFSRISI